MGRELFKNTYRTKSLRVPWWDYSNKGDYFITIRTDYRGNVLGRILNDDIKLNKRGRIVKDCLIGIPYHFKNVMLKTWVIMPDHVHLLIRIRNVRLMVETQHRCISNGNYRERQQCCVSTNHHELIPEMNVSNTFHKLKPGSIPVIIRSFKSACTRQIHEYENNNQFKWQRSFYDKIIFND